MALNTREDNEIRIPFPTYSIRIFMLRLVRYWAFIILIGGIEYIRNDDASFFVWGCCLGVLIAVAGWAVYDSRAAYMSRHNVLAMLISKGKMVVNHMWWGKQKVLYFVDVERFIVVDFPTQSGCGYSLRAVMNNGKLMMCDRVQTVLHDLNSVMLSYYATRKPKVSSTNGIKKCGVFDIERSDVDAFVAMLNQRLKKYHSKTDKI